MELGDLAYSGHGASRELCCFLTTKCLREASVLSRKLTLQRVRNRLPFDGEILKCGGGYIFGAVGDESSRASAAGLGAASARMSRTMPAMAVDTRSKWQGFGAQKDLLEM